jgi:nitric oxide reductase NorD protein
MKSSATGALSAEALEELMEAYLDAALSSRRDAPQRLAISARDLAVFDRQGQQFVLRWGAVIAKDNAELAYQLTAFTRPAMRLIDLDAVESSLLYAMDLYDKKGQIPAIRAFQQVADFLANMHERLARMALEACSVVLERLVCGLYGRPLEIAPADTRYRYRERLSAACPLSPGSSVGRRAPTLLVAESLGGRDLID